MIVQLHLTDEQVAAMLNEVGYETGMVDETEWRSEYHNRCEPVTVSRLHVILSDGQTKPAKEFFETIIDEAIINIIKTQQNGRN